ncbi:MAG TPA: TIGR03557 family F420-dependent LLM class oxidoreductase [Acidimicrobiales bacterium]|jgi:G6PDH family F420-dependent oxidoreductase|nr:TIGR03557 family F420-dependent LLM class oxidoreductase [Acidimicrobiales bacterium]
MKYGYSLYCEGNSPRSLIEQAVRAEDAGFDFLVISDHYHPWLNEQRHAGFAWSILGAVAQATDRIELATMVTCPIVRYHPAIVAQAAATMGVISGGRFTLGLGAGENLNEHVVGRDWPPVVIRHAMLGEAIDIIEGLWRGGFFTYQGKYFNVYDAQVFDLPDEPVLTFVGASGARSAELAVRAGGLCVTSPEATVVQRFTGAGGDPDRVWGQIVTAWAPTKEAGLDDAYHNFRFSVGGWKVQAELPNPVNFTAATSNVKPSDLDSSIPAGPDAKRHLDAMAEYAEAGVQRLALAYPGDDFDGFFGFWRNELRPNLG